VTPVAGQYNWRIAVYRKGQKVNAGTLLGNVLFLLSNATYGSGLADSGAKDYKLKPGKYRLLVELWHCSATVTVSQGGKQSVAAKPTPAAKPQIPKNQEEALGYIRACGAQAAKVRQEVRAVQGAIYLAAKSPTQAHRTQLETVCVFRRIRPPGPIENGHLVRFNSAARSAPLESTRSRRRR